MQRRMDAPVREQHRWLCQVLNGHCYSKVEMSRLSKVEMSPFAAAGGGRFERGRIGDERDGAGAG